MKRLLPIAVVLILPFVLATDNDPTPGFDPPPPGHTVTFCHVAGLAEDPANTVTITTDEHAAFGQAGHFSENGTPNAGHEQDYLGPCTTPTGTPSPTPTGTPCPEDRTATNPDPCEPPCPEDRSSSGDPKDCPTPTPTPTTPPPTTPPPVPPPPTPVCEPSWHQGPWFGDPRVNLDFEGLGLFVVRGGVQRFSGLHKIVLDLDCNETARVSRYKVRYGRYLTVTLNGEVIIHDTPPRV